MKKREEGRERKGGVTDGVALRKKVERELWKKPAAALRSHWPRAGGNAGKVGPRCDAIGPTSADRALGCGMLALLNARRSLEDTPE